MDFEKTEEQKLLTHSIERLASDFYSDANRSTTTQSGEGLNDKAWKVMAELGLLALPFSEEIGGFGGKDADISCVMIELGKKITSEPLLPGPILAGGLLERLGTDEQIEEWAPRIIEGSAHLGLAHAETDARFNLRHVETSYAPNGRGMKLSGRKTFVLGAADADGYIISAKARTQSKNPDNDHASFFLVRADAEGLKKKHYRLMDGSSACEIELTDTYGAVSYTHLTLPTIYSV